MKKLYMLLILAIALTIGVSAQDQEQDYTRHTVSEGESVNAIARFYEITVEELFRLNPGARSELKPGDVLLISPKNTAAVQPEATQVEVTFKKHRVRRKETLYSISRKYNIPIEDIKRYNEELYERELKKGDRLKIPIYKVIPVAEVEEDTLSTVVHVVQPKETRWGIANSYGITIDKLQELNPEMEDIIKTGDSLYLPAREVMIATPGSDEYVFYEVKPKETLYSLTRFLNISMEELQILNPALKDGLKAGMVLKLPKARTESLEVKDNVIVKKFNLVDSINTGYVSNIAFMLPFKLDNVRVDSLEMVKKKFRSDRVFNYAMDFYSGAMMAVDSLKKLGLSVNVQVFDTEGRQSKIDQLLASHDFTGLNAVIGPFYSTPFNTLSEALKGENVPVIAPLTNKNIKLYSNVFQTVPSEEYLRERMMDFMVDRAEDKQIMIITDNKNAELITKLQSAFPDSQTLIPEKDRTITLYQVTKRLSQEKENWIILETDNQSLVANVTSVLNSIKREKYTITLLTTYRSSAFDGDNISNIHLSNLAFHYPTIDKLSLVNSNFSKQYETEFYTTPSRYAVRGFDITFDVLLRLAYGGNLYEAARSVGETSYIENKFDYGKKFFGGYYNKAYYIVKYDNLAIKEVEE